MAIAPRILAFAGSLRAGSFNRMLVRIAADGAARAGAEVTMLDLRDHPLPIFDQDLEAEAGIPPQAKAIKRLLKDHQGLLIAAPEYNSSITAVLKNTIDWASRSEKDEPPLACFDGKVAAIIERFPGALGGLRGLVTVRSILSNIRVLVLPDQQAIPRAHEAFTDDGRLADEQLHARVEALGARVADVVRKLGGAREDHPTARAR